MNSLDVEPNIIPNILHFVYLMMDSTKEFQFSYFLAIASAYVINKPKQVFLYVLRCPHGLWWEKISSFVTIEIVALPTHWGAKPMHKMAHKADFVRLEKLYERGGVYMDLDTITVRPYQHLLSYDTVMGKEVDTDSLCCAIMLTKPKSLFFKEWMSQYESIFQPNGWGEASCVLPFRIYKKMFEFDSRMKVLDPSSFFKPYINEINKIFVDPYEIPEELITLHLWETFSRKYLPFAAFISNFNISIRSRLSFKSKFS
jgi:hypothetical protein